ncbi:MAG: tetratricopeptide repeat-containing sulfotransferase family protein [Woeseiaceae bacterium]
MPNSIQTYLKRAGDAYQKRSFDEAERFLRKALDLDASNADILHNLGALHDQQRNFTKAADYYSRALNAAPERTEVRRGLASLYFDQGKHDESRNLYAELIQSNGFDVDAHFAYSRLTKYQQEDSVLDALQELSEKVGDLPWDEQIKLCFTIGKANQDLGNFSMAFDAFKKGNELHYARYPYDERGNYAMLDDVRRCLDTDYFATNTPLDTSDNSPVFVLGMPRSGSTLVEQILASHTNVAGAGELKYLNQCIQDHLIRDKQTFTNAVPQWNEQDLHGAADCYLAKLHQHAAGCPRIVDKMPGNFAFIGIISQLFPNAKIIHTSRHPMATFWSSYSTHFGDALHYTYNPDVLCRYIVKYREMMSHWHSVLPNNRIYDIEYEQIVENPEHSIRGLLDYLDLQWEPACLEFHTTQREVKTASVAQVRQPLYATAVGLWRNYQVQLGPYEETLLPD